MDLKELNEFGQKRCKLYNEAFKLDTKREQGLALLAKANEEMGELTNEVLLQQNLQRNAKSRTPELEKELADVMIMMGILASQFKIDLDRAVTDRVKIIDKRTLP